MANDHYIDREPEGFSDFENELLDKKYFPELRVGEGREVPKDRFIDDQEMQQDAEESLRHD